VITKPTSSDTDPLELLRQWRDSLQSVAVSAASLPGLAKVPQPLVDSMERQLELLEAVFERERRLQRELVERTMAPVEAILDMLEQSAAALHRQAEALSESAGALHQASEMIESQAGLFERTIEKLREPAEFMKSNAGGQRGRARGRKSSK